MSTQRCHTLQSSIHVRCKYRTAIQKFSEDQLNESKIRYSEMAKTDDNGTATHVVTQIQYGADVTFTKQNNSKIPRTSPKKLAGWIPVSKTFWKSCPEARVPAEALRKQIGEARWAFNAISKTIYNFPKILKLPKRTQKPSSLLEISLYWSILSDSFCKDPSSGKEPLGVPITVWRHPLELMHEGVRLHSAIKFQIHCDNSIWMKHRWRKL